MKKRGYTLLCTVLAVSLWLPGVPVYAASVQVTLPTFRVTLNDKLIDNDSLQYPLIVYRDITYFPMTFYDCHYLGLDTYYAEQTGLEIKMFRRDIVPWSYHEYESSGSNPRIAAAQVAAFPIRVNGRAIENNKEEYPLLLYKDITYFPLTWRYAVNEFDWDYSFSETEGLRINSFKEEAVRELLEDIYGDDIEDIVRVISDKLINSEWISYSSRAYSRYENRLTGIISQHRPTGTIWQKEAAMTEADNRDNTKNPTITWQHLELDGKLYSSTDGKNWVTSGTDYIFPVVPNFVALLSDLLEQLPEKQYGEARWDFYEGYPCLALMLMDETPLYMPKESDDGASMSAGGINRHQFFIDLNEGCLRSYWVSVSPFYLGENGEYEIFAPSTTFYSVMDISYEPIQFPVP